MTERRAEDPLERNDSLEKDSLKNSEAEDHATQTDDGLNSTTEFAAKPGLSAAAALHAELEKSRSEYLYLRAEFDNFRKNSIKERSELLKYGAEKFLREFLDIQDTLLMALNSPVKADNFEDFVKGIRMIADNVASLLAKSGVKEESPLGKSFDPATQEALTFEVTTNFSEGQVCRVFRKSYTLHDRLLRPAQVVVARKPEIGSQSGETHSAPAASDWTAEEDFKDSLAKQPGNQ